jgi:uncharacterized protein YdaU (DUF1376 family)
MRLHAMFWFIDRWRSSTAYTDMSLEEQGAYRNLLDEAQIRGGVIPDEERILEKACGDVRAWKRVRTAVLARFTLTKDGWRNETLDKVLAESVLRAEKQRRYRNKAGNVTPSPSPSPSPSVSSTDPEETVRKLVRVADDNGRRAGAFVERYQDEHLNRRGVAYIGNPRKDYEEALQLVRVYDDATLDDLMVVFLASDDDFTRSRTATVAMFRSRASWCQERLQAEKRRRGIA